MSSSAAAALMEVSAPAPSATATLTQAMAAGNEAAFREFHALYFDRLLRYQFVLARGNEQAARDALQETLTRVAGRAKRFETEEAFWSWLTVLARSAAVDNGRRRQRYWKMLNSYALSFLQPRSHLPPIDANELLHNLLDRGLAMLDLADRELLNAKYLEGAGQRDLARDLGVSEKALESRLLRLRRELRRHIEYLLRHEHD